jgi:hypothetical protein
MGVLDFETPDGRARLRAIHPGHSPQEVQEATGFDLVIPDDVPESEPPTQEELTVLREVVDPLATRQTEFRETRAEANERIGKAKAAR